MNKKIDVKMLVLDMDGTLLNKEHTISEKNKKYIQLAKERGVKVVLVSGRDVPALKIFSKILNLNEYIGAMNGAIVYDVKNEEIIGETYLRKEHVDKLFEISNNNNELLTLFKDNIIYASDKPNPFLEILNRFVKKPIISSENLSIYLKENNIYESLHKAAFIDEYENLKKLYDKIYNELKDELSLSFSLPFIMEIFRNDSNKMTAVQKIAELYNIDRENILAMGDGENDISMLEFAGHSVSPANCMPSVVKYVDEICTTNDRDAVAEIIKKYILV